ncbi:restriction endonuclease subunit S [uncultured Citrobacter sp.]|uniref:restriction endonuclease subunit S n=1 Tax=uncultured Citrobacter sp. TaxID=200446 RepID=UPI00280A960C|nr:restriction endonuclease subunit S [uncultured Citrobacter sp.]EIP7627701.1 restriction endonuclease subunit S [Escherichia coli]MDU5156028.1 restriction endonuclease subunit S [Citrobacter sp.]
MNWPMVKLGDVCTINPRLPKNANPEQEVTFLAMAAVSEKGEISSQETRILHETKKGFTYFERGDVLLAKITPCFENGKATLTNNLNTQIGFGSTEFHVLRAIPDLILPEFIFYLIWNERFRLSAAKEMTGSAGQKRVSADYLKEYKFYLPSIFEQEKIVSALNKGFSIRRKRQQAIKLADDFLRATFLEIFGDPISNSKNWELKKLGNIADCQLGKMLSQKSKNGISPKKYLRNANVRWRKIDIHDLLEMDFNETEKSKFELRKGDLLVCEGGEIGRCAIWNNQIADCYYQKALHRVRPNYRIVTSVYLQEYLYSMAKKNAFSEFVSEVTFSHLTAEKLKNLLVPVPPLSLQEKFELIYNKFNELLDKYNIDELSFILLSNSINKNMFTQSLLKDK